MFTASTTPSTASRKSPTRTVVLRRARAWLSKNVTASVEGDARRLPLLRALGGLQRRRRREAEGAGDDARGQGLAADVVVHDRVVVALARERDAVLGARQLLLQCQHGLVGL